MMREIDPEAVAETLSRMLIMLYAAETELTDEDDIAAIQADQDMLQALIQRETLKAAKLEPGLRQH